VRCTHCTSLAVRHSGASTAPPEGRAARRVGSRSDWAGDLWAAHSADAGQVGEAGRKAGRTLSSLEIEAAHTPSLRERTRWVGTAHTPMVEAEAAGRTSLAEAAGRTPSEGEEAGGSHTGRTPLEEGAEEGTRRGCTRRGR